LKGAWLALAAALACTPARADWPRMADYDGVFPVDLGAKWIEFRIPLKDVSGKAVHEIVCRGGNDQPALDALQCQPTFPLEDDSAIGNSRMQFRHLDLVGACARYPEFGRLRNFRVQGMRVTLEARNVLVDKRGKPRKFDLRVSVRRDPGADQEYTQRPGYLHPKGDCRHVKDGSEPLMCQDEQGNSGPCPSTN
jgi:hypothetical protein